MERLADFNAIAGFSLRDLGGWALNLVPLLTYLGWFVLLWVLDKKIPPPRNGKSLWPD